MRSSDHSNALDLDRDLPTTAEDVAALRRAGMSRPLDLAEYIRFLERLPQQSPSAVRTRRGPHGDHPFELSD